VISLKQSLGAIGVAQGRPLHLRSDWASWPRSLRQAMRAMVDPQPGRWAKASGTEYGSLPGGFSCDTVQGLCTDGAHWYVPVTENGNSWVHKFDATLATHLGSFLVPHDEAGQQHVGDIDIRDGNLFLPLQGAAGHRVLVLADDMATVRQNVLLVDDTGNGDAPLGQDINSWCAISPWNGLYYTCAFGGKKEDEPPSGVCYAFDPGRGWRYTPARNIRLSGADVSAAQGGKFDGNGHLLITSDDYRDIRVFSALNGHFWGSCAVDQKDWDELEGLCIWSRNDSGVGAQVHVASVVVGDGKTNVTTGAEVGAIVGGILLGPLGALAGAATGAGSEAAPWIAKLHHLYRKSYAVPGFGSLMGAP